MFKRLLFASVIAVASFNAAAAGVTYTLDPQHTNVIASWSHFGYSHPSANFGQANGTLVYDAAAPEKSSVQVTLPLAGLDTFVPALDAHLKSADFFDAGKFPVATFTSNKVQALGKGKFKVTGVLTIKGIAKPVVLDATLNNAGVHPMTKQESIGFDATTTIKRSDFGVGMYAPAGQRRGFAAHHHRRRGGRARARDAMIIERPAGARGVADFGWLRSSHTFSFGNYHDPAWMGFGPLRVINDDTVAGGGGFAPHRHANMEIISVVLDGALAHKDSSGNVGVIRAGDVQWMSAGHGIEHSEYNDSATAPVHFLQLWIQPDRLNAEPAYGQRHFDPAERRARWAVLASPDGEAVVVGDSPAGVVARDPTGCRRPGGDDAGSGATLLAARRQRRGAPWRTRAAGRRCTGLDRRSRRARPARHCRTQRCAAVRLAGLIRRGLIADSGTVGAGW